MTGIGGVSYNSKRNLLGGVSLQGEISYHLWQIDNEATITQDIVKLNRKSKWKSENKIEDKTSTSDQQYIDRHLEFLFFN